MAELIRLAQRGLPLLDLPKLNCSRELNRFIDLRRVLPKLWRERRRDELLKAFGFFGIVGRPFL